MRYLVLVNLPLGCLWKSAILHEFRTHGVKAGSSLPHHQLDQVTREPAREAVDPLGVMGVVPMKLQCRFAAQWATRCRMQDDGNALHLKEFEEANPLNEGSEGTGKERHVTSV